MAGLDMIAFITNNIDFLSIGLILLVFVGILKLLKNSPKSSNLPPGPSTWSVLWNSAFRRDKSTKHTHEILTDLAKRYGNIMRLGHGGVVVLSDLQAIKEALIKQPDVFSDRSVLPIREKMGGGKGSFIWDSGETAKMHRRFGLKSLRNLGVGKKSFEHKINEELRYLIECLDSEGNRSFDPYLTISNAVSNIICSITFGYRFEYDDKRFHKMLNNMKDLLATNGPDAIGNRFPVLINTPMYSSRRRWKKDIDDFIGGIVKEHHAAYDPNDHRDFIDMYIAEVKQKEGAAETGAFRKENIPAGIMDLFAAGSDTTSNSVLWMLMCAIVRPEIQDKIQQEISNVVGDDRQPSCEDRPKMPYTHAVIMEVQRWRPVALFALPYKTSRETQLLGYTIPKGQYVLMNLWAVMHDPKIWERPHEFDPSRFLTEDGQKVVTPEAFIPFSIGRRSCLGESLAKMELFLFVTNLFQRFTFKLPTGRPRPKMFGVAGTTFNPTPFEVCAVKR